MGGATVKPGLKIDPNDLINQAEARLEESRKLNPIRLESSDSEFGRKYAFK
jgi:hypothetical protein